MKNILVIAGFDPSSGAGIGLDLKVIQSLGEYGVGVISALTCQDTSKVYDMRCVDAMFFESQLEKLLCDVKVDAVKIGMIASVDIAKVVLKTIERFCLKNIVCDPVLKSTSNFGFANSELVEFLKSKFYPACDFITPNKYEMARIFDIEFERLDEDTISKIRSRMDRMGIKNCIVKGGHFDSDFAIDVLISADENVLGVSSRKVFDTDNIHGTGCAFSSAFATFLAKGYNMSDALKLTKQLMSKIINNAVKVGNGRLILNP